MTTAIIAELEHGIMADLSQFEYGSVVYGFRGAARTTIDSPGTLFGFVWSGSLTISEDKKSHVVTENHYFSIPVSRGIEISGGGAGYGVFHPGYKGLSSVGGPVENLGRLKYIDGCSDTLLIAPPIKGDPCFNLLHFPSGIDQTKHTHPSIRAGLIHGGEGRCITATDELTLSEGKMFILYPDAIHAFSTRGTDGMNLTVYHPDSDFGPTHEEHPMLNRTIVDGVSARFIDKIRTTTIAAENG